MVMWDVGCKPRLIYGSEVWACSSSSDEKSLEQIQERAGRVVLGVSWRFPGVVVRGELGWVKLKSEQHAKALAYAGRLRALDESRWLRHVTPLEAQELIKKAQLRRSEGQLFSTTVLSIQSDVFFNGKYLLSSNFATKLLCEQLFLLKMPHKGERFAVFGKRMQVIMF